MSSYHRGHQQLGGLIDQWEVLKEHGRLEASIQMSIAASLVDLTEELERIANALELLTGAESPNAPGLTLRLAGTPRKEITPMPALSPITVDTNHNLQFVEGPKDAAGASVPDTISWSSSNTAVLTIAPAADGLSALAVTVAPGTATVTVTDGTNTDTEDVTVVAGAAVALNTVVTVVPK